MLLLRLSNQEKPKKQGKQGEVMALEGRSMNEERVRLLIHIPIGFVMGISPIPCEKLVDLFIAYEFSEDKWIKDQAWYDLKGSLYGYVVGRLVLFTSIGLLLWRLL